MWTIPIRSPHAGQTPIDIRIVYFMPRAHPASWASRPSPILVPRGPVSGHVGIPAHVPTGGPIAP